MTHLSDDPSEEQWIDDEAGRIVRPYVMTRGRTEPSRGRIDLITLVVTLNPATPVDPGLGPEHHTIVRLCERPLSVAEIAAHLDLPAGTVRVMLGDLVDRGLIAIQEPARETDVLDLETYKAVLNGLRTL
ncbi:hypothetical protein Sme01_02150 [Sphaerisporangium melleum]|uniref:DUF742 domain-containing protein n=1 Tax=Sphaerisporangium melleum TaxID=321316 RepID=A0A917R4P9_9ACTN|nr:DUF742 domain-containing protein [Sphaerisporangium melleum]GGK88900.1 hypothetical protein GCM10007964_34480 [Sphaerisporangium melleum]GII67739.1 hypothetical protein Sme01_02150 [Sphaerisporangium melleum]